MPVETAESNRECKTINYISLLIASIVYVSLSFIVGFDLASIFPIGLAYVVSYAFIGSLFYIFISFMFPRETMHFESRLLYELSSRKLVEPVPESRKSNL